MNNMQKHKNNSGFTLVELIVVMCIMGIIMGAVLNFLRPTAQLYNTTNKYLNQEEAVDMIADYLKDDLMYATGVFIIESNQADINAVAQRTNAALTGTPDGKGLDYKNCIVLDNASIRSSGTAAAIRKEATGTITKYALKNEHFVDVASDDSLLQGKELYRNTFALQDQSFMGEDQYRFSVESHITEELCSLTVHMEVASLVRDADTDTYKVHEIEYEADKPIEFINFKKSTATHTFAVWQDVTEFEGNDYIYIFYDRKDKITQDNVRFKCQFYLMGADGKFDLDNFVYETTVVDPADLREEVQKNVDNVNLEMIEDENYVYRRTKFYATKSDIYDITDPSVVDLSNVTSGAPGSVLKLYAVYTRALKTDERYTVNFYHDKDKNSPIKSETDIPFGGDITDRMPEWEKDAETSSGVYEVQYWASCVTEARQNSFNHITSDLDVYEASYKEYKVSFVKQDGTPAEWTDANGNEVDYLRVREGENILDTQLPNLSPYMTDFGDYSWVFKDGEHAGETVDSSKPINAPTTVTIKFVPKPAVTFSKTLSWNGWNNDGDVWGHPKVTVSQTDPFPVGTTFEVRFTFTAEPQSSISNGPWGENITCDGSTVRVTGNTVSYHVYVTNENVREFNTSFQIKAKEANADFRIESSDSVEVIQLT